MAYRPILLVDVEALGATFRFGSADKAMSKVAAIIHRDGLNADDSPETFEALCELFVEGVKAWEGVEEEDGKPKPCTFEKREAIPTEDKFVISSAYMQKRNELEAGKLEPEAEPTASTAEGTPEAEA
jgi:hypothetical protein